MKQETKKLKKLRTLLEISDESAINILSDIANDHDCFLVRKDRITNININMGVEDLMKGEISFLITSDKIDKQLYEHFYRLYHKDK